MNTRRFALAFGLLCSSTLPVAAHGSERGFVMLLPTGHVILGGALTVALSFLLITLLPRRLARGIAGVRLTLGTLPRLNPITISLPVLVLLLLLIGAGRWATTDPLLNPLPLLIWTFWWVVLLVAAAVVGDLWAFANPLVAPAWIADRLRKSTPWRLPEPAGGGLSLLLFFGFGWYQLVSPAPDDPRRLAVCVSAYLLTGLLLIAAFGDKAFIQSIDPFARLFALVSAFAPLRFDSCDRGDNRVAVALALPGVALASRPPLSMLATLFILLTLCTVSFDGIAHTFWWLGLSGINPLEFPGRSAVIILNSAGLAGAFILLSGLYLASIGIGRWIAGEASPIDRLAGRLVWSMVPISIAFHAAHYLTALLVNGQYLLIAASDPFASGWDLLGFAHHHVTTSFLNTAAGAQAIFAAQTSIIVVGHVVGVVIAHLIAVDVCDKERTARLLERPLAMLMVAYTMLGLWTLSTPTIG